MVSPNFGEIGERPDGRPRRRRLQSPADERGTTMNLGKALLTTVLSGSLLLAWPADAAGAGHYYLALGDSVAFGLQPTVPDGAPASAFRSGYADVVARRLRADAPELRAVNLSCPGETTSTFVSGGCPWQAAGRPLHRPFAGSQLGAALAFLRAHRGRVSPITLTLWSNDASAVVDACGDRIACIRARAPAALATFSAHLTGILRRLRAAAPGAAIVVTGDWNTDVGRLRQTDPLARELDRAIARSAAATGARFAETFPLFNPRGPLGAETGRICTLTFICSEGDGHPTDAGYRAIAGAVLAALGAATAAGRP
jgi:lysophospholipase L1-like esterase